MKEYILYFTIYNAYFDKPSRDAGIFFFITVGEVSSISCENVIRIALRLRTYAISFKDCDLQMSSEMNFNRSSANADVEKH